MLAVISIAVLVSLLYKGNYKRTLHEQRQHSNVHFADGANSSGNILHADGSSRSDETSAPPISALLQTSCTSVEHGKSPGVVDVSTNSNNSSNNHSNLVRVVSQDNSSHLTFSHSQATRPSILPTNNWVNNVQVSAFHRSNLIDTNKSTAVDRTYKRLILSPMVNRICTDDV